MGTSPVFRSAFMLAAILFLVCTNAHAATIGFDSLAHGEIVNSQYDATFGVRIGAVNIGGGPDLAIVFDSSKANTSDPDLEAPFSGGNLADRKDLGNMLIIGENDIDSNGDGLVDDPDDEGSRPAGSIFIDFDTPITSFGFDIVDVEGPDANGNDSGYSVQFFMGETAIASVGFGSFLDESSLLYDSSVAFGDNSANHIDQIIAAELGASAFDRVEINFGGSAAIDNLTFTPVPLPSAIFLLGAGLCGLAGIQRKKFKK